jgi:hypothetical protein
MSARSRKKATTRKPAGNRGPVEAWEPSPDPQGWSWLVGRRPVLMIIVLGLIVAGFLLWPRVSLLLSPARPIVNSLSQDVLWVDPELPTEGVEALDADRIRGIIGERPLGVVVLAPDNDAFDRPLDACTAIVDRIDDLTVMVIQDGELGAGCQGDDVPITDNEFGYDFVFWEMMDRQTAFLHGDIPAQVAQLALFYDARVAAGDVEPRTRTFSAPAGQWLLAAGLVLAVTGGVLLLFFGLRRAVLALQRRVERRRRWRAQRDDLDAELQLIALVMLDAEPGDSRQSQRKVHAASAVSADYILVLDDLSNSVQGSDLTSLRQRVQSISDRLQLDDGSRQRT